MKRFVPFFGLWLACAGVFAESRLQLCGSFPERVLSEIHLSREETRRRAALRIEEPRGVVRDVGDVVLMDRSAGVVGRRNEFDLVGRSLAFEPVSPTATGYRVSLGGASVIPQGTERLPLGDDDSFEVQLPFEFVFYGRAYRRVWVNSDGNLTFEAADSASTARSLGRMVAGPPRIAPLFRDLDPERSGRVMMEIAGSSVTFAWLAVPDFRSFGVGPRQTFAVRLESSGRIEFTYETVNTDSAVVGIGPGDFRGSTEVVSFDSGAAGEFAGTVAETFELNPGLDLVRVAQRFYETHGDSYDYLVIFNSLGISADGAIAFQMPIRVTAQGYGLPRYDVGGIFGSRRRLQSIVNMGPLFQYPDDPAQVTNFRPGAGESTLTILAHEAGHQYLSFVSVPDPANPFGRPMLGRQQAHWSFFFNSDASILEGNRIEDQGEAANPRFRVTATVAGYSALDRYLMGLGAPEELQPTFFVRPSLSGNRPEDPPRLGASFNGARVDIPAESLTSIAGRRTPDHTVAQNRFRFAFILVTDDGANPAASEVEKLDRLRREFEPYFARSTGERGAAETSLRRELRFETFPAAGVLKGETGRLVLELRDPAPVDLIVRLRTEKGLLAVPESVSIPAGGRRVEFVAEGLGGGVEELGAFPERGEFEIAYLRVQVAEAAALLLSVVDLGGELRVRVSDRNELPYPGAKVTATVQGSSVVDRDFAETDSNGIARFGWQRGLGSVALSAGGASVQAPGIPILASALNAASLQPRVSPGSIVSAFGVAVEGPGLEVAVAGLPAEIVRSSFGQVDFVVPESVPLGTAVVVVRNQRGASPPVTVLVTAIAPALFVDGSTGLGAVVAAGEIRPFRSGEFVEIYGTGLAVPVHVRIGGVEAEVLFAGRPPSLPGVWQLNARIPEETPSGEQPLVVIAAGEETVPVRVRIAP
jgi:uncharacterized protein (TIGR03437 family)